MKRHGKLAMIWSIYSIYYLGMTMKFDKDITGL